jgi:pyruvate/2-oxoglutarate dehydrogenase complex dihydrolipoamide dehydrogenase (E3) component
MSDDAVVEVDLVVVGLGPGGEDLATKAARAGLDVLAVDARLVGGECPYFGCIPTKMMVRGSDAVADAGRLPQVGGEAVVTPSWAVVAERIRTQATDDWDDAVAVKRLEDAGVRFVQGRGRLDGPKRVTVAPNHGGAPTTYAARRGVVLNPGTRPATPPVEGLEGTPYWTNREAVQATEAPASLVVVGGGPIGCELAQAFSRFGSRVTVVQHGDRLLPGDEPEAGALLADVLTHEGVRVMTGAELSRVEYAEGTFTLTVSGETLTADRLLVAAGRTPHTDDIGLETVGLEPGARSIEVDDRMRAVGQDGLWVLGDVTGKGAFTHVSMYQAAIAERDLLGEEGPPASYHALPHVTFTDPEVGGVGMSERQARDAGLTVRTGSAKLEESSRGFTHGPGARGLVKVVEDAERGVLVGATAAGPAGGEILGFLAVAVHAAVPVDTLRSMIYAYPTFHRAIETALGDLS